MSGTLVILNPHSNKGRAASLRPQLEAALRTYDAQLVETAWPGHGRQLAFDAACDSFRMIVAVGGDGTLHEIATGIMQSGRPVIMGIVPAGSGNDYAYHALRLPRNPRQALYWALNGTPVPHDMAHINDTYFQNSFGVGLDANVAWDVVEYLQPRTRLRGQMLYTVSALRQIFLHYDRCPTLEIRLDNSLIKRQRVILCATHLGPTAGAGYRLNPLANPRDGLLDICLARVMARPKALLALQLGRYGLHHLLREVRLHRCKRIQLRSEVPVKAHIDGELLTGTEWDVQVRPGALQIMLPRKP